MYKIKKKEQKKSIKPAFFFAREFKNYDVTMNQSALLMELTVRRAESRKWPFVIPGLDSDR